MGMVVNNNIPALFSFNAVTKTGNALQKSIQKLSTGLRINSAADDAAGLAISEKMRAQIRGLDRAVSNSQDGISMIQTAEGALNETHSILQRMRELSVQSANDTLTQQDRGYIQLEIDQLREEITRIGNTTQFNKKKLLDGSAAVLWSSDNLNTKAIVNGGLRQVDQFGQKNALEGNYNLKIKALAGVGEVQKSDIFKVKHKDVISVISRDYLVDEVAGKNLTAGKEYTITGAAAADVVTAALDKVGNIGDDILAGAAAAAGNSIEVMVEVIGKEDNGTEAGKKSSLTLKVTAINTDLNGSVKTTVGTFKVETDDAGAAGTAYQINTTAGLESAKSGIQDTLKTKALAIADVKAANVGDKIIYGNTLKGTADTLVTVKAPKSNGVDSVDHSYNVNSGTMIGKTANFKHFELDKETGQAKVTDVSVTIKAAKEDGSAVVAADLQKELAKFKTYAIGDVARDDVKLRDLDKFWDAQGRFLLKDAQTLTLTQGDGRQTKVTLYANDTLKDVAEKLNKAIGRPVADGGLGQAQYADKAYFATFVNKKTAADTSESVAGTFVIRSLVPGATGRISFAGDEDLIKALSLNVIQEAKESNYTVSATDAHTGKVVVSDTKTTGNRLIGVLHPNIDVEFDAMAGISAKWDESSKSYIYSTENYETVLHLADNTTVFQIGANEGEDMGINIGDMRSHALGLNAVLVTDRASAARSITIIDNAIDKVSTQRAKLGAYQNRLEHTINNLTTASENLTAAESRIRDTDMAKEMMNFTKLNIMLQAGNAMLAQANQLPQGVLSLIR